MPASSSDALPSWNDGETKHRIINFVQAVTGRNGAQFVAPPERIAAFDMDGTLWTEQPLYPQAQFVLDYLIRRHAGESSLGVVGSLLQRISDGLADIHQSFATLKDLVRESIEVNEYLSAVRQWLNSARHPCFDCGYTDLIYQPMRELLDYLRANEFRTYIVSGTGIEFIRAFSADVFGIPPEQVIGSSLDTNFVADADGSNARLDIVPWPDFIDNGKRKAESINEFIGRRPILAFGNSDGDKQMLEWTAAGGGARLMGLVHHTDAAREYEYDANAHVGHLELALAEAKARGWDAASNRGWVIADMKADWNRIYSSAANRNNSGACRPR